MPIYSLNLFYAQIAQELKNFSAEMDSVFHSTLCVMAMILVEMPAMKEETSVQV